MMDQTLYAYAAKKVSLLEDEFLYGNITQREFEAAKSRFDIFLRQTMDLGTFYTMPGEVQSAPIVADDDDEIELTPEEDWDDFQRQTVASIVERYDAGLVDEALFRSALISLLSPKSPQWNDDDAN